MPLLKVKNQSNEYSTFWEGRYYSFSWVIKNIYPEVYIASTKNLLSSISEIMDNIIYENFFDINLTKEPKEIFKIAIGCSNKFAECFVGYFEIVNDYLDLQQKYEFTPDREKKFTERLNKLFPDIDIELKDQGTYNRNIATEQALARVFHIPGRTLRRLLKDARKEVEILAM